MWKSFHHPNVSLPVVRRRIGLELLEMLNLLGEVAVHGAWAFLNNRCYPDHTACVRATDRLSKQGLLVELQGLDTPVLRISDEGSNSLEDYFRPDKWWGKRWNGTWYLLVYDIPEADRPYRNTLRQFLKQQRMGCFQKSVWITSFDIRPQYEDLELAASLGGFACLFEARTVLGMPAEKVVRESWDFDRLFDIQKRFCDIYAENLTLLQTPVSFELDTLMRLAAEEIDAYRSAFALDPLLPNALLPANYMGKKSYALHLKVIQELQSKLSTCNPD
ncbi:MAG: hypothetical protein DRP64_10590 [Verrucomicrobia bacterium]|nr:MAG: hypothetical protein DRP64_10590 [Verrucomicrobiota bacterium]